MQASLLHPLASAFVVDAFIIRRAAFPSMPKTAKPYADLTLLLVHFASLCVILRIYSYFMHLHGIYSARCASRMHGRHRLSGRAHNGRFMSFGWRFIPPPHKFLQRLLYWMQVKICVMSPLRRGQRKFKKQRRCHYNEKTAHQFSAGSQHDAEHPAHGGGGGRHQQCRPH